MLNHIIEIFKAHESGRDVRQLFIRAFEEYTGTSKEWLSILLSRHLGFHIIHIETAFFKILFAHTKIYFSIFENNPHNPEYITPQKLITIQVNTIEAIIEIATLSPQVLQNLMRRTYRGAHINEKLMLFEAFTRIRFNLPSSISEMDELKTITKQMVMDMEKMIQENIDKRKVFETNELNIQKGFFNDLALLNYVYNHRKERKKLDENLFEAIAEIKNKVVVPFITIILEANTDGRAYFLWPGMMETAYKELLNYPDASEWIYKLLIIYNQRLKTSTSNLERIVLEEYDEIEHEISKEQRSSFGRAYNRWIRSHTYDNQFGVKLDYTYEKAYDPDAWD
jgi:hypothetical protein